MARYRVRLYLGTYTEHIVDAEDDAEAYAKAEERFKNAPKHALAMEALANAECRPEADTVERMKVTDQQKP